jgi:acetyl-CoA synthetase
MANIESVMQEKRVFEPGADVVKAANVSGMDAYRALCAEAERDFSGFWGRLGKENLAWHKPFTQVLDESNAPFFKWFADGELNASYNCLDVQVQAGNGDKTAIIFEADDGKVSRISYKDLLAKVCQLANGIKSLGFKKGERAIIYMPMSIEAVVAMQACARLGITHSVVFGGFSAKSVQERVVDAGATLIICADEQMRGGKAIPLKPAIEDAFALGGCEAVRGVIVYQRTGGSIAFNAGRDVWMHELMAGQESTCEPEWVNAEHPLFILYTSGSTGKPKGVQHATGGYLLWAVLTMKWTFDIKPSDVFCWGARPPSAGSPATLTCATDRWLSAPRK